MDLTALLQDRYLALHYDEVQRETLLVAEEEKSTREFSLMSRQEMQELNWLLIGVNNTSEIPPDIGFICEGLILKPTGSGCFSRIGFFSYQDHTPDMFEDVEPTIVTII